jgi:hypothetical protein
LPDVFGVFELVFSFKFLDFEVFQSGKKNKQEGACDYTIPLLSLVGVWWVWLSLPLPSFPLSSLSLSIKPAWLLVFEFLWVKGRGEEALPPGLPCPFLCWWVHMCQ